MKGKVQLLLIVCILCMFFMGCNNNYDSSVSEYEEASQSNSIQTIAGSFNDLEDIGKSLFACFNNYNDLGLDAQYKVIKEAESHVESMLIEYNRILDICRERADLSNIAYQIQLLKHAAPLNITSKDAQSLNNAATLYQLYFQQLSSSFTIMAEDMECINSGKDVENTVEYYKEMEKLPMPETIIAGINFSSKAAKNGSIQYTYTNSQDDTDAQLNYNLYLVALGMNNDLTLQFDDMAAYVYDGNIMVSAIMAGKDGNLGNFFIVSFPDSN